MKKTIFYLFLLIFSTNLLKSMESSEQKSYLSSMPAEIKIKIINNLLPEIRSSDNILTFIKDLERLRETDTEFKNFIEAPETQKHIIKLLIDQLSVIPYRYSSNIIHAAKTKAGASPLYLAHSDPFFYDILEKTKFILNVSEQLKRAITENDSETTEKSLQYLRNQLGNPNAFIDRYQGLILAAKNNNLKMIELLLTYNPDVDIRDDEGHTALEILRNYQESLQSVIKNIQNRSVKQ